jgi:hypothetical protein
MALTSVGFFANMTVTDSGGNKSVLKYKLVSEDIETAVTDAGTIITALNAITDGVITSYSVGEEYDEDTSFLAAEGVQVENVAMLSVRLDNTEEKWAQMRIPAPNIGIFQATTGKKSNVIDPADSALNTYLDLFVTDTGICKISDGEYIADPAVAGNVDGKRIHRASRKG